MSLTQQNVSTLQQRLQDARNDLAIAESNSQAEALTISLADDPLAAGEPYRRAIATAKEKVTILSQGLAAAKQAEQQRLQGLRADEERSRIRACRRNCGAVQSAAARIEQLQAETAAAVKQMIDAAASAKATLPPHLVGNRTSYLEDHLGPRYLEHLITNHGDFVSYRAGLGNPQRGTTAGAFGGLSDFATSTVPSLSDLVRDRVVQPILRHLPKTQSAPPGQGDKAEAADETVPGRLISSAATHPDPRLLPAAAQGASVPPLADAALRQPIPLAQPV